jgi:monovalent cation/hydrogen antiporter
MDGQVALRPPSEDDLAMLEELTQVPEQAGEFDWFGAEIDALAGEDWTRDETVQRMRNMYEYRKRRLAARAGKIEDDGYEDQSLAYQQMVQLVLRAQREALLRLRSDRKLSNEVMNRIMHELDLEESRLEI